MRVKGVGLDFSKFTISMEDKVKFDLEEHDGWHYIKGNSVKTTFVRKTKNSQSSVLKISDDAGNKLEVVFTEDKKLRVDLKEADSSKKVSDYRISHEFFYASANTDNCVDKDLNGWPDESEFKNNDVEKALQLAGLPLLVAVNDDFDKNGKDRDNEINELLNMNQDKQLQKGLLSLGKKIPDTAKLQLTYDESRLRIWFRKDKKWTAIKSGEEYDVKTFKLMAGKVDILFEGMSKGYLDVKAEVIEKGNILFSDTLNVEVQPTARVIFFLGDREDEIIEKYYNYLNKLQAMMKVKTVAPSGRFDIEIKSGFSVNKNDLHEVLSRGSNLTDPPCQNYWTHIYLGSHGSFPIFCAPDTIDMPTENGVHPDSQELYKDCNEGIEKYSKILASAATRDKKYAEKALVLLKQQLDILKDKCKPVVEGHVLRSFMEWGGKGSTVSWIPKDLLPPKANIYSGVTIVQRSCFNYWFCGAPEEWPSQDIPYGRMGYELTGVVESSFWRGCYICPIVPLPGGKGSQGVNSANVGLPELIEYYNQKVLDQNPEIMNEWREKIIKESF